MVSIDANRLFSRCTDLNIAAIYGHIHNTSADVAYHCRMLLRSRRNMIITFAKPYIVNY